MICIDENLKTTLKSLAEKYEVSSFCDGDPSCILRRYHDIADILTENYRWNNQTWYDNRAVSRIAFTWMNYSPISIQGIPDNYIMWTIYDVRQLCTKQENGGWKF